MQKKYFGNIEKITVKSEALKNNLLGDTAIRETAIYLPHGYSENNHYPLIMMFAPYNSSGLAYINWKPFNDNLVSRLDRLIFQELMPPAVVAFPDCFSRLGGNQYINSIAVGNYEDYLIQELLPSIEKKYHAGGFGHRGCIGKSSGGFGAITHGMRHADVWSAFACHAGGAAFEHLFLCYAPQILDELALHNRSIEKFILYVEKKNKLSSREFLCLMQLSFAAAYDPDPNQFLGIRLPVDLFTGELITERWLNWQKWDPTLAIHKYVHNLSKLKAIFLDCGNQDQFFNHYGSRRIHNILKANQINHIYEEFPDNHTDIDYRFDKSIPYIATALSTRG